LKYFKNHESIEDIYSVNSDCVLYVISVVLFPTLCQVSVRLAQLYHEMLLLSFGKWDTLAITCKLDFM